jgi:hypothetical protein
MCYGLARVMEQVGRRKRLPHTAAESQPERSAGLLPEDRMNPVRRLKACPTKIVASSENFEQV